MKLAKLIALVATVGMAQVAVAVPLTWTDDLGNDASGTSTCEIYGVGSAVQDGRLYFGVRTNVPQSGLTGYDGRATTHFSPGDIYIKVGTTDPFGLGQVYGIATTSHGNVVQQAYPGETWTDVTEGYLYTDAVFSDGTYEDYEAYMTGHSQPYEPDDQDGSLHVNSYFALIKSGNEVIGESDISYQSVCGEPWDYEITGWVSRDAIGLGCNTEYALFFSLECGNDGAEHGGETGDCPIPEPAGASLMLIGLLLARRRRR